MKNLKSNKTTGASQSSLAITAIRKDILDLTLLPSEHLDEKTLLKKYPYGRTPLREAISRLMSEGLIETKNGRGAYVAAMSIEQTFPLLEALLVNEHIIATYLNFENPSLVNDLENIQLEYEKLAASQDISGSTRTNQKLHFRMAKATNNPFFIKQAIYIYQLKSRLSCLIFETEIMPPNDLSLQFSRINIAHRQIINSIKEKNRPNLISLLRNHASSFKTELSMIISGRSDFEINFADITSDSLGQKLISVKS
ncbi:MAG: DNA-binding GntR family transcriptional regulator [Paracoccaceae bacterium]|jgi:DNA-binding GntR family transcriptional regulator